MIRFLMNPNLIFSSGFDLFTTFGTTLALFFLKFFYFDLWETTFPHLSFSTAFNSSFSIPSKNAGISSNSALCFVIYLHLSVSGSITFKSLSL